ncbi:unnamed protein product [marine sediment metagenome]|uniref:Uncharacterized protein n=1 Tax=marine sediment metagenome TaxID=412755 RepID=X1ECT1_9ZZZZ
MDETAMSVRKQEVLKIDGDAEYTQLIQVEHACDGSQEDAVATITVHHDGYLMGIQMSSRMGFTTNGEHYVLELSKSGNFQAFDSGNPDTLCVHNTSFQLATQGATVTSVISSLRTKIFFRAGERIYLNAFGAASRTVNGSAVLFWRNL